LIFFFSGDCKFDGVLNLACLSCGFVIEMNHRLFKVISMHVMICFMVGMVEWLECVFHVDTLN